MRVEQISKKKDKLSDCGPLTQHEGLLPVTRRARPLVSVADSWSEISAQQAACSLQKNLSFFFFFFFPNSSEHQAVIAKRRPTLQSKRFIKSHRPAESAGKVAGKREFRNKKSSGETAAKQQVKYVYLNLIVKTFMHPEKAEGCKWNKEA